MPAFLTHWRVLIETARRTQDAGSDLGSLIVDANAMRRRMGDKSIPPPTTPAGAVWNTGPLPSIEFYYPGSDISAMAYLGALAPDIPFYQSRQFAHKLRDTGITQQRTNKDMQQWAPLLHARRSGDFLLTFLESIAKISAPALRSQALAFAMGYLSHIATDLALNPWISMLANTYRYRDIPGLFAPLGKHFYVELCLDEYLATTYFKRELYGWLNQPWVYYVEPTMHHLEVPSTYTTQVIKLLAQATETTYGFSQGQQQSFFGDYIAGLERLRLYLAGRGTFRWLTLNARLRRRVNDPIIATIAGNQHKVGVATSEAVLAYAVRLSEHLCRRAISYYASLRNSNAMAEERNQRRSALCADLRNWDLTTGYDLEVLFDETVIVRLLHNWIHFAALWPNEN